MSYEVRAGRGVIPKNKSVPFFAVAEAPDGTIRIIEVKTGKADLSIRQSEIFPQIRDGSSIPRGQVAENFGLIPGKPLMEQGYPNGIPIEVVNFPGAK